MKRRILTILLAALLLAAMIPAAFAAGTVTSGSCGEGVTWRADPNAGTVTISGSGAIGDYLTSSNPKQAPWRELLSAPRDPETYVTTGEAPCNKVIIQPGVTAIGANAFALCNGLTEITIPSGVTAIGDHAFLTDRGLTEITLPDSVTAIGEGAFSGTGLTGITLPAGVKNIGPGAFNGAAVTVAAGNRAFSSNAQGVLFNAAKTELLSAPATLTTYEVPAGVTAIGEDAFSSCYNLTSVTVPSGVTTIKDGAFAFCVSLAKVVLPASVKSIGAGAFGWCDDLTDVYYRGTEAQWAKISIDSSSDSGEEGGNGALTGATIHCVGADGAVPGPDSDPDLPFTDVPAGAFYADAVKWALENDITTGTTTTTFAPNKTCTREQIVTFLWRAYDCPEPKSTSNPFTDVAAGTPYYKAILWAAEEGITSGVSDTAFNPSGTCTRAQAVTFQYRAAGEPPVSTGSAFADVPAGAYYADAVSWAVANGITDGTTPTTFAPNTTCTRGHIVTFLWRELGE